MTILRAQISLNRDSGIPADVCMNTWHFLTVGAATPAEASVDVLAQLETFYQAIDGLIASYIVSPLELKVYDLQDPEPRVPILDETITISTGTGNAFPAEVAICLSYRGLNVSGTNPARRRGRIFIGPLDDGVGLLQSHDTVVNSTAQNDLATAAEAMSTAGLTADARWVVFSPTSAGPAPWTEAELEAASVDVVAGWIDGAFDTIRSRGSDPQVRTNWAQIPV